MERKNLIRTTYLYLFSLIGLVLLVIGSVKFVNMGLKAFVFKQADEEYRLDRMQPPMPPMFIEEKMKIVSEIENPKLQEIKLSGQEMTELKSVIKSYRDWQGLRSKIDPVRAQRHRDAAINLALIIIGFPLYFYHWVVIKREKE